ncbi:uncharacterized protein LOC111698737 [Eurytemora carolleeae]|uniref:uncharacterized protein LOC111698737 n=1 Tax=Eurytemora carolleeae TaxID=1294199 RepID=UPI000C76D955|nr:uncharacterized protein LOC111698737 [Eurytemora carolleeae]|eukprot:XP_023324918.1 uncharacterized protein LOC111698737 [Eurytemora affinis]
MLKLLLAAVLVSFSMALPSMDKKEIEERFGAVNWDPNVKTLYCSDCIEVSVESTGGTLEHQPMRLGRYTVAGSLWENWIPLFKSESNQWLTPDPNSNPVIYYIKWVISETVGGFNAGVQNNAYTDGFNCPWEIPDNWEYEYQRQWFIDPTLKIRCTKYRNQE